MAVTNIYHINFIFVWELLCIVNIFIDGAIVISSLTFSSDVIRAALSRF